MEIQSVTIATANANSQTKNIGHNLIIIGQL